MDRDFVFQLESRLVNAWPAFEIALVEGWLLRFAEGYSRRANSASAILPGATLAAETISAIAEAYRTRGLPAAFRLTGIEDATCDAALEHAGFRSHDPSLVLAGPVDGDITIAPSLRFEREPSPAWIAQAAAAYGGDKADGGVLGRIVRLIPQPAAFATVEENGQDRAWGLAVVERGYVGLYDIVVDPGARGHGLGRILVTGLMAWAQQQGVSCAYLQVREGNTVARSLYDSLGFTAAYRYTQRIEGAG